MGVSFHWLNWRLYVFNRFKILFGFGARFARWLCRFASLAGCGASLRSLVVALACASWLWRSPARAGCVALLRSLGLALCFARWVCYLLVFSNDFLKENNMSLTLTRSFIIS